MSLKIIGSVLVILGAFLAGNCRIREKRNKIYLLLEFLRVLDYMKGNLRFGKMPLPELFAEISRQYPDAVGTLFFKIKEELEGSAKRFFEIWKTLFQEFEQKYRLGDEFLSDYLCLGQTLGQIDLEHQISSIDFCIVQQKEKIEKIQKEQKKMEKVTMTISVCMGIFLLLLFL